MVSRLAVSSVVREDPFASRLLDTPDAVISFWRSVVACQPEYEPDKETLIVILLTTRLAPFAWHLVSLGSLNETIAHPREILRPALISAANGIILAHNHPSGDPSPSSADEHLTKRIRDACDLLQIRLLDHVVVIDSGRSLRGASPWFSFRQAGFL